MKPQTKHLKLIQNSTRRRPVWLILIALIGFFVAFSNIAASHQAISTEEIREHCSFLPPRTQHNFTASQEDTPQIPQLDWQQSIKNINLDLGVPISGQDDKLLEFAIVLGASIQEFRRRTRRKDIGFRIIVSRYSSDIASQQFRRQLAEKASLKPNDIVFVSTPESNFHRAFAINLLHKATKDSSDSVLAIVDVDMNVGPRFLFNALTLVSEK